MLRSAVHRNLLLFTKPARAGEVKTRLIGELSPERAAELHAAFRDDLLGRLSKGDYRLTMAWALAEGEPIPPGELPALRQIGDDLGERLFHALAEAARTARCVGAVGSDHPLLTAARVEEAFSRLEEGAELVLGPATDGGYYLVGARSDTLTARLFEEVPWSTERVLETTLNRAQECGLAVELLEAGSDVDTPEDLLQLAASVAEVDTRGLERTVRLLSAWGYLDRGALS